MSFHFHMECTDKHYRKRIPLQFTHAHGDSSSSLVDFRLNYSFNNSTHPGDSS
jgi:hypothetical protein